MPEGWWDATVQAKRGYVLLAVFAVSETLLLFLMDWEPTSWGGYGLLLLFGLIFIFSMGFIELTFVWKFRHGRKKIFEETFVEMGERTERLLDREGIAYQVDVDFSTIRNRDTRRREKKGTATYSLAIDGEDVLILLTGWVTSPWSWIAVEPWMGESPRFLAFVNSIDEEFKDVNKDYVPKDQ